MRIAKSFTLEPELSDYVNRTKGSRSASDRVNDLLRRAMMHEKYERLEAEARAFYFAAGENERKEARAFQRAARRTFERE